MHLRKSRFVWALMALFSFFPRKRADGDNVADVVMVVNRQEIVEVPYALGNIILGGEGVRVRLYARSNSIMAQRPVRTNVYIYDDQGVMRDESTSLLPRPSSRG